MNEGYLTVQEVANRLKIKKNTVYEMIKRGDIKATKIGKQFRVSESELYNSLGDESPVKPQHTNYSNKFVVCGQDSLLDLLCEQANSIIGEPYFVRSYLGSYNGLYAMYQGQVDCATAHLWDYKTNTYNIPFFTHLLPAEKICAFNIVERQVGFYVKSGNPKNIFEFKDILRKNIKCIAREKGSGIRILMDSLFCEHGIDPDSLEFDIANSHLEAAAAVNLGNADCAIGNEKTAIQTAGIDFIPLKSEKYDIVFHAKDLQNSNVQILLSVLKSDNFAKTLNAIGGYDTKNIGKQIL